MSWNCPGIWHVYVLEKWKKCPGMSWTVLECPGMSWTVLKFEFQKRVVTMYYLQSIYHLTEEACEIHSTKYLKNLTCFVIYILNPSCCLDSPLLSMVYVYKCIYVYIYICELSGRRTRSPKGYNHYGTCQQPFANLHIHVN